MVNYRLQHNFIVAVLLLSVFNVSSVFASSAKLILFVDKYESDLGRPIRAELYGVSIKTKIADIDLSPLSKDFGVVEDYVINETSDKRWPNKSIQVLKFKLYPRQIGKVIIPRLILGDVKTKLKTLHIHSSEISIPKISFSTSMPYERQQIIVHVLLSSNDSSSRLSINKELKINGFASTPLPFTRTKENNGTYTIKIGWAITSFKSGKQKLELPAIEYSKSGVSRKQFYLPLKTIAVKALPSYLPATIPVGKVTLQSQPPSNRLIQSNAINYWKIKLKGNINDSYRLPAILRQIRSNNHIKILPSITTRSKKATGDSLISSTNYSIPFKVLNSGIVKLPKLKIQYFNPDNGKIITESYQTSPLFSLTSFWRILITIVLLALMFYLLRKIYLKALKFKATYTNRKKALDILKNTNKLKDIKQSIKLLATAEHWPQNTTLNQWYCSWNKKYKENDDFEKLIPLLSSAFYSSKVDHNLDGLSTKLYELVKNRKST